MPVMSALSSSVVQKTESMPRVYIGIGSNIDREENIRGALEELNAEFGPLIRSNVYETEAIGFEGDAFYNLVVGFDSERSVDELKAEFDRIEKRYGRTVESRRFAPRTLDLDLLLYGDLVDTTGTHDIPRKEIGEYAFVLLPLSEIAGDLKHPVTGERFADMWSRFPKNQRLSKIKWSN
jgi:2-amino-4-hydroxy-6-hydroxymethyldihydropteridine diphosphokinase